MLYPVTLVEVLAVQESETECDFTPVPESGMVVGSSEAVLTKERLPVTLPVMVGANFTLTLVLAPTARFNGSVRPLIEKPEPVTVASESVRLAVRELFIVSGSMLLLPTRTFPKLRFEG